MRDHACLYHQELGVNSVIKNVTISRAYAVYGTRCYHPDMGAAPLRGVDYPSYTSHIFKITHIDNLSTPAIITNVTIENVTSVIKGITIFCVSAV